jgi:hypothetical protein
MNKEELAKAARIIADASEKLWELTGGHVDETNATVAERIRANPDVGYIAMVIEMLNGAEGHLDGRIKYESR